MQTLSLPQDIVADGDGAQQSSTSSKKPRDESGHGGGLTKVTVNLVPRSVTAIDQASAITHDTKTETINRAVQLYAWAQKMIEAGYHIRVVGPDGQETRVELF